MTETRCPRCGKNNPGVHTCTPRCKVCGEYIQGTKNNIDTCISCKLK